MAMRLDELAAAVPGARILGDAGTEVAELVFDSRRAGPGALFFCVRGERADGHGFAAQVVEAGAVALVVDHELELAVPQVLVADVRASMAPFAARFQGDPTATLRVAAVTGTNGKTTTAFLLREILESAGVRTGLLGTVKQVVAGVEEDVVRTTPEAIDLQATFRRMLDGGDEACAMEVSSHALVLHRAAAIHYEVAIFTNLTQDHLDFHTDMEDYFRAKRMLFEAGPGTAIVNVDDPYGARLASEFECVTISAEGAEADYTARDVDFTATGATFTVEPSSSTGRFRHEGSGNRPVNLTTRLPGDFNVANGLGAFAAAVAMGVGVEEAAAGLAGAQAPPGRFEPVDVGQGFAVLVDYAHTPDSLENVLRAARRLTPEGRVISVFGAGGDRDRDKRPKMGLAGAEGSDLVVITSDNPRSEQPEAIVAEVAAGAEAAPELEVVVDRRAAIALALGRARAGDTVVIAGKGHEQGQEFADGRKLPFDDREVAREELRRLAGAGGAAVTSGGGGSGTGSGDGA